MVVVVICEHTVTMANITTSDLEKAIAAATSNLKGEAAQQGIMHAAQYTYANNEEMRHKARQDVDEVLAAPVEDKVCSLVMEQNGQVNDDDQEIGAYMFRRTIPFTHLAPADRLYRPFPALIKAFLDSGAKAVICPSTQPEHETKLTSFHGSCDFSELENVKFEIELEEVEEEEDCGTTTTSHNNDWENMTQRGTRGKIKEH
ncbi:hypothetical protein Tco_1338431 [Tanacetum coccineum]